MRLITGTEFDRILLEPYHGLIVEFQPDGKSLHTGSEKIEFTIAFAHLNNGQVGLSIQLPSQYTFRSGTDFVLVHDKFDSKKIVLKQGIELEKLD